MTSQTYFVDLCNKSFVYFKDFVGARKCILFLDFRQQLMKLFLIRIAMVDIWKYRLSKEVGYKPVLIINKCWKKCELIRNLCIVANVINLVHNAWLTCLKCMQKEIKVESRILVTIWWHESNKVLWRTFRRTTYWRRNRTIGGQTFFLWKHTGYN